MTLCNISPKNIRVGGDWNPERSGYSSRLLGEFSLDWTSSQCTFRTGSISASFVSRKTKPSVMSQCCKNLVSSRRICAARFYVLNEDFRTLLIPHRADLPAATLDSCKNLYAHASEMMFPTPPSGRISSVRVLDSRKKDLTIMGGEFMRLTERMMCSVPSSFVLLVSSQGDAHALPSMTTLSEVGNQARYEPSTNRSLDLRNLMGQIMSCRASEVLEEVEAFAHSSRGRIYFMTSNVRDIIDADLSSIAKKHKVTVLYLVSDHK